MYMYDLMDQLASVLCDPVYVSTVLMEFRVETVTIYLFSSPVCMSSVYFLTVSGR